MQLSGLKPIRCRVIKLRSMSITRELLKIEWQSTISPSNNRLVAVFVCLARTKFYLGKLL